MIYFTFALDIPYFRRASIVILSDNAASARSGAYTALRSECGAIGRIMTASADAKRTRKLPSNAEPLKQCYSHVDGKSVQWAWIVVEKK